MIAPHDGEHFVADVRLLIAPAAGVFHFSRPIDAGDELSLGEMIGTINEQGVHTRFAGTVADVLVWEGERVMAYQPLAWLQTP